MLFLFCTLLNLHFLVASPVYLTDLRCENLVNPNGIDTVTPHFSWKIKGDSILTQQYCEMQVATDTLLLKSGKADLWDAKIQSAASVMVPYEGAPLQSRMLCYWSTCVE